MAERNLAFMIRGGWKGKLGVTEIPPVYKRNGKDLFLRNSCIF